MITDLTRAVSAVCPIDGVSIGRIDDRSTWRVTFQPSATESQRSAAQAALAAFDALASLKASLVSMVDADAETARLRYITPGAGMSMTYAEKFAQANAVHELGRDAANALVDAATQFPTLSASIGLEAETLWDCAQLVIDKYEQFAALSGMIERTRLVGKKAIRDASDAAGARAAYEGITWPTP